MRAVVCDRYGPPDVLRIEEVERPVPGDDEVLVRIHASTVNRSDAHHRAGTPFVTRFFHGLRRPRRRIPGSEFAGEVAEIGAAVTEFTVGDRVFGVYPFFNVLEGAHAEFMRIPERAPIVHLPAGFGFEEAAAVPDGAILALGCLRRVGLHEGQRILIYGASGSIGTAAVQLARHFGAHVTAVCNTKNLELVRSLGADEVIDYTREDFTKNGESETSVVFDIPPHYRKQDLLFLRELLETGKYRPVIDRSYPLDEVAQASRYVETQQKTGNVVLMVP